MSDLTDHYQPLPGTEGVPAPPLEEMEKQMIEAAMDKHQGNLTFVANQLGISRQTLYNKIKRYDL